MEKGIILIENPKSCIECPMCYHSENMCIGGMKFEKLYRCKIEPDGIEDPYLQDIIHEKPAWCPIKPLPEKKDVREETTSIGGVFLQGKETGWNDCIDEILKGETIEKN